MYEHEEIIPETIMLNDMHRYPLKKLQGELDPILTSLYSIIEVFINKNMLHHIWYCKVLKQTHTWKSFQSNEPIGIFF